MNTNALDVAGRLLKNAALMIQLQPLIVAIA
jgi:hypothetical protein